MSVNTHNFGENIYYNSRDIEFFEARILTNPRPKWMYGRLF